MNIKQYKKEYQDQVVDLWTACGLVMPWNNPVKDIQRKLDKDPELFLVGTIDGILVSSVMGGYEGHRGWINYLAVKPELQKAGYGRQMVQAMESRMTALGCPKINLQIRSSNKAVIAFYESLGYKNDHVTSLGKRLVRDE